MGKIKSTHTQIAILQHVNLMDADNMNGNL